MIRAAEYALHAKQTFGSELASKASEVCVCVWRAGVCAGGRLCGVGGGKKGGVQV